MQVSYGKPTVNDGKEMGERRLPLPCNDGDRTLSHGATRSKIAYFGGWKNSLLYDSRISRSPNFWVKILS